MLCLKPNNKANHRRCASSNIQGRKSFRSLYLIILCSSRHLLKSIQYHPYSCRTYRMAVADQTAARIQSRQVDVRIISATNKDLKKLVEQNRFREDLYYRLNIIPIHLPPLRERIEDIGPLAHLFLNKINHTYKLHKKIAPGIMHILESYQWPGIIREMEHMIERLAVTLDSEYISRKDLPFVQDGQNNQKMSLKQILHQVEKEIILEKMKELKQHEKQPMHSASANLHS